MVQVANILPISFATPERAFSAM
ncbi:hypothetical protein FWK35_00034064, partial [Aphis craccivora]